MYRQLDPVAIVGTCDTLAGRIAERFPGSGLSQVGQELSQIAHESASRIEAIRRPHWLVRLGVVVGVLVVLGAAAGFFLSFRVAPAVGGLPDLLQAFEAAVNDVVFLCVAIYFLFTVETRLKRRAAFRALHELRSIAHVIDMHQLTKDPEQLLAPAGATASSRPHAMTRFELARYLDYCSELLSITSKLAALYVQSLADGVVLAAVNDIHGLTGSLSAKIWQKIVILDTLAIRDQRPLTQ